ncbi:hypothetical protein FS837_012219 [Tulasnella sp. UAMH 9824]|nr:hypothetical protein FS837_012219 [Tulasnella sp. UAMH 9824]
MIKMATSVDPPDNAGRSYPPSQEPSNPVSTRTPITPTRASIHTIPPEIMSMIFGMSDKRTCVAACLVCRRWSGVAIDGVWRSLSSLLAPFELLGPLVDTEDGHDLHPDCALTEQSWALFRSRATRVRSLTYDEVEYNEAISSGLIIRALAVYPGGILPNLQEVHWHIYLPGFNHLLEFCPPSLDRMSLHICGHIPSVDPVKRLLCDLLSSLASRLRFFEFGTESPHIEDAAIATILEIFLKGRDDLLELNLPPCEIRDPVTVSEVCQASPQLRSFCAKVLDLTKERFREALSELAGRSESLRRLWLCRTGNDDEILRLNDTKPMLQLSAIEDIRLRVECTLILRAPDIQQMGEAWKGLRSLILYSYGSSGIPLSHLATFARWFPALQKFSGDFDCFVDIPYTEYVKSRFQSLHTLIWLNAEIMDNQIAEVAEFLAMVCGPDVEIRTSESSLNSDDILDEESPWEMGDPNEDLMDRIDAFWRVHRAIRRLGWE